MNPQDIARLIAVAKALPEQDKLTFVALIDYLSARASQLGIKLVELRNSNQLRPDADFFIGQLGVSIEQIVSALSNVSTGLKSAQGQMAGQTSQPAIPAA